MNVRDPNHLEAYSAPRNPYERESGKWYWYDETADDHGPFDTEEEAEKELDDYIFWLETGIDRRLRP